MSKTNFRILQITWSCERVCECVSVWALAGACAFLSAHLSRSSVYKFKHTHTHTERFFSERCFRSNRFLHKTKREFKSQHKIYEPAKRICEWTQCMASFCTYIFAAFLIFLGSFVDAVAECFIYSCERDTHTHTRARRQTLKTIIGIPCSFSCFICWLCFFFLFFR